MSPVGTTGRAIGGLLALFAEFEGEILRERVRAGLARARERGRRLGPMSAAKNPPQVQALYSGGLTKSEIARPPRDRPQGSPPLLKEKRKANGNVARIVLGPSRHPPPPPKGTSSEICFWGGYSLKMSESVQRASGTW